MTTEKTIVGSVRDHIKSCPALETFYFGVDHIREDSSYMIEQVPTKEVVGKPYVDGTSKKQFAFAFSSKESYGEDVFQNIANLGFYEKFKAWMEECNDKKDLPDLSEDKQPLNYEVLTGAYAYNTTSEKLAQYRIQCRLLYLDKKGI